MKKTEKLTKLIYIASPYTGRSKHSIVNFFIRRYRYYTVTSLIGQLQDRYGYAFIGPITQSHNTARYMKRNSTAFDAWKIRDLTYISRCDELWVVMMPGWNESKGVLAEIEFAKTIHRCKVRYLDPKTLKFKRTR